jgi:hypothetical protein
VTYLERPSNVSHISDALRNSVEKKSYPHLMAAPNSICGLRSARALCWHALCEQTLRRLVASHDHVVVQAKLDGTNVDVARMDGVLYPLQRAGYVVDTSPFEQH